MNLNQTDVLKDIRKIYICGLAGSGKGLLRPLLDGHSQVLNCPIQGYAESILSAKFEQFIKRDKLISQKIQNERENVPSLSVKIDSDLFPISLGEFLEYLFSNDQMGSFLNAALSGEISVGASAAQQVFVPFQFNFNNFIFELKKYFINKKELTVEELQNFLYGELFLNWSGQNLDKNKSIVISTIGNCFETISKMLNSKHTKKIIIVKRNPIELSFTRAKRFLDSANIQKHEFYSVLYDKNFIKKVNLFEQNIEKIKNNKDVFCVDFKNIIFKTEKVMKEISNFLEIPFENIMTKATLNGQTIENNDLKFTNQINDDPEKVLKNSEIKLLKYLYKIPDHSSGIVSSVKLWLQSKTIPRMTNQKSL